jgi:hypothetical protein
MTNAGLGRWRNSLTSHNAIPTRPLEVQRAPYRRAHVVIAPRHGREPVTQLHLMLPPRYRWRLAAHQGPGQLLGQFIPAVDVVRVVLLAVDADSIARETNNAWARRRISWPPFLASWAFGDRVHRRLSLVTSGVAGPLAPAPRGNRPRGVAAGERRRLVVKDRRSAQRTLIRPARNSVLIRVGPRQEKH